MKVDQLIAEIQQLSVEEIWVLYQAILKQIAVPLQNPRLFFDDWDDVGVDALYTKSWWELQKIISCLKGGKAVCPGVKILRGIPLKRSMRWTDYIQLPRLDIEGQEWTVERQIFKMMEELGEVSQAFYKENGLDKMAAEALDFVQTGVTLLYMLEAQGVDVDSIFDAFMSKLGQRGYLKVV